MSSPILLHNLVSSSHAKNSSQISIYASPFGSGKPVIPTARSITVARVASPISIDRTYQALFLESLKTYFSLSGRLVKQGDLIAISIDTDTMNHIVEMDSNSEGDEDIEELDGINQQ